MASNISIVTDIPETSPVYNKVEFCVKENDAPSLAMPNYHFVFDIVTEVNGTIRTEPIPRPVTSLGVQNVGPLLEGFIKETLAQFNSTFSFAFATVSPIIKFHIEVLSAWDVAGVFTVDPDGVGAVVGSDKYLWGASLGHHDWIEQINDATPFETWIMNTTNGTSAEFLTTYKTPKVDILDLGWHWTLTDTPSDIETLEIKTYDTAGVLIQTVRSVNATSNGVTNSRLRTVTTAPQSLNNITAPLLLGSQPIITSSVATYTVQVLDNLFAASSEILNFEIGACTRYDTFRLHFENILGGFDSYNFKLRSVQSSQNEKKKYTRGGDNVNASGLVYDNKDGGTVAYYVKSRDKIKLESEYLTNEENTWLKQLIDSPQVYLEFTSGGVKDFKPVFVNNTNWTDKDISIDKLFRLTLDIDLGHENYRQRR